MKLKFKHPVLLIFLLFSLSAFSQSEPRDESTSYEKNVNLLQNIETSKAIVLFENDNFVIQSTIEVVETNLNDWIKSYPNLDSDKTLLNKIKELENKKGIKSAQEIAKNNGLTQRLLYRIADILKEGKCTIYNKKEKKIMEVIKIETYSYHCGELCGEGGRRFFIDKQLLFSVVDWLS